MGKSSSTNQITANLEAGTSASKNEAASAEKTPLVNKENKGRCQPVQTAFWITYGAGTTALTIAGGIMWGPGAAVGIAISSFFVAACIACTTDCIGQDAMCCDQEYVNAHPTWESMCCPPGSSTG